MPRFGLDLLFSTAFPALVVALAVGASLRPAWAGDDQSAAENDSARMEFFEAKIRPVLVNHCYECHAADAPTLQGGLRLDSADAVRHGGDSGPAVVAGDPDSSLLLSALKYESFEMPPAAPLDPQVVRDFEVWIRDGALDPRQESSPLPVAQEIDIDAGRSFWAFQPPQRSAWLAERDAESGAATSGSDRIDRLVGRRLAEAGLGQNPPADRRAWYRRLSFDLTGLPPDIRLLDAFVRDQSPGAEARAVDAFLASEAYGERWARLWLDLMRYAEDQAHIVGNNKALFYPNAWLYRDWVIQSLNQDLPYDDFIRLQLAADLLHPGSTDTHVALGFIGLGPKYYRRGDPAVMADEWEDRVDVIGRGVLGLTVACARCHDHKYDPIRTEDYYGLAGVFASTQMHNLPMSDDVEKDKSGAAKDPEHAWHVVRDHQPHDIAVMIRGDVAQQGDVVPRSLPEVLFPGDRRVFRDGSGRRELAESLVHRDNPLTARVIVNRIWQQYFGRGLVATTSNFGKLGERPTHPELLDDLAVRFMENGWSLKWLHRQIILSRTYRQSSALRDEAAAVDPLNRLLWRVPHRRLSVEAYRDAVLAAAGQLSESVGGASIDPSDPEESRRTVYSRISRLDLNPLLARFDFPDPNVHAARRVETNTPLQKLFLLNSPFMLRMAESLSRRATDAHDAVTEQIQFLFESTLSRRAAPEELRAAEAFLAAHSEDGTVQLAQSLMISNEFWFLD